MTVSGYIPYLVAAQRTGLDLSLDPWLIPEDAYQEILDGYQYLGIIYKRGGYSWFDSMPHVIGTPYQNITNITNGPNSVVTLTTNHGFTGTKNVRLVDVEGLIPFMMTDNPGINGTLWVGTFSGGGLGPNQFSINNDFAYDGSYTSSTGTASYFPGNPIMAIANWIDDTNNPNIMVLDTRRAAIYDPIQGCLVPIGDTDIFTGDSNNLFWWENYKGDIYFTNNVDNIYLYGDSNTPAGGMTAFTPIYSSVGSLKVDTCLMIQAVGSRLCLFNTTESGQVFPTRVRWCAQGTDPTSSSPNPWDQLTPGQGGFADLLDSSYIISLAKNQTNAFIMSQGYAFSTVYEMRPISDPQFAFAFTAVSTSRNVNSTFGTIIIDRVISAVGNSGLILTDGNNITRYDEKIPNFVLDDIDQAQIDRCFGVRNDAQWQTWLAYPSNLDRETTNNSRILVWNYQDKSWSVYRISMACLGTINFPLQDPAWGDYVDGKLGDLDYTDFAPEETFASVSQNDEPSLVGGDYEGNIWYMNKGAGDAADMVAYNQPDDDGDPITFSLTSRQWFPFAKEGVASQFGHVDLLIDADVNTNVTVNYSVDNQGNYYTTTSFPCFPYENVLLAQISNMTQANPCIVTAPNHPFSTGMTVYPYGVGGMVQLNNNPYTVTVIDAGTISLNVDSTAFSAYTGYGYLSNTPLNASPFWIRTYAGQTGVFHQMNLTTTGVDQNFGLHALILWFKKSGRIYR